MIICALILTSASCSSSTESAQDVTGDYWLVSVGGVPRTDGAVTLSAGGSFSRWSGDYPKSTARPLNTGVYSVSGTTITLDLLDESNPTLRTATGKLKDGVLEYVPHYQSKVYSYRRE